MYPIEYAEPTHPHHAQTDGIVASHSLIPDALYHAFAAFGALMSPELPLSRRQHEMITTVVSATTGASIDWSLTQSFCVASRWMKRSSRR